MSTSPRLRSPSASQALDTLSSLSRFFPHNNQLAQALGWTESTVAQWQGRTVIRPQRQKIIDVLLLSELCAEVHPYLHHALDVGLWINAPLPNLNGHSPATWLRQYGQVGLKQLTYGMVDWMPRVPDGELAPQPKPSAKTLTSQDPGVVEFHRMLATIQPQPALRPTKVKS